MLIILDDSITLIDQFIRKYNYTDYKTL